jgi:hypothetical protein
MDYGEVLIKHPDVRDLAVDESLTAQDLADELNSRKIKSPKGRKWTYMSAAYLRREAQGEQPALQRQKRKQRASTQAKRGAALVEGLLDLGLSMEEAISILLQRAAEHSL